MSLAVYDRIFPYVNRGHPSWMRMPYVGQALRDYGDSGVGEGRRIAPCTAGYKKFSVRS